MNLVRIPNSAGPSWLPVYVIIYNPNRPSVPLKQTNVIYEFKCQLGYLRPHRVHI